MKQAIQAVESLRLPSPRTVGIKISGRAMETTSTKGTFIGPGKFKVLTRAAAAPSHYARPIRAQGTDQD